MKRYVNLIISSLSLFVTALLLVVTMFSWYVSNDNAKVTGVTVSTKAKRNVYISSTYDGVTALTTSNYTDYGFGETVTISHDGLLDPTSSYDATNFYYANTDSINEDGTYLLSSTTPFTLVTDSDDYYINCNLYICSLESEDFDISLSNVSISNGTVSSSLYKAVRVSATYSSTTKIYKTSEGDAYPVTSTTTVSETDPAVLCGSSNELSGISLPKVSDSSLTAVLVNIKIWIEGQNSNAISCNDSSSFKVNIDFDE